MNCFGIDFGTTNSCAFELNSGVSIGDAFGRPLPSIVAIDKATGRASGGRETWDHRLALAARGGFHVIPSVKELLDTDKEWFSGTKRWSVAMVVAEVLKQLSDKTELKGAGRIERAVMSIPVGMTPRARRVLREAAEIAGIKVNGFVKESTAALIRYWETLKNCRHVAVFDWGGGTLDISILQIAGRQVLELATAGIAEAGNRIDDALSRHVHLQIMRERASTTEFEELPEKNQDDLLFKVEAAKCALSETEEHEFVLWGYDGADETVTLSRRESCGVLMPYVEKALDLLAGTIARAKLSVDSLDDIVILGGCSKLWLFQEGLGSDPRCAGRFTVAERPEWDVAIGAAMIEKHPGSYVLGERLALQLSDGGGFDLARPGDRFDNVERNVALGLVEDARAANIIIDRSGESGRGGSPALQFTIPTQGFDLEGIALNYRLTDDLTFFVRGKSRTTSPDKVVEQETGELHFRYSVEG